MTTATRTIEELANREYQYGFVTDVEAETVPKGLNEEVVRLISEKKREPAWLLEWRLKAYRTWLTMTEPTWQNVHYPAIDYQDIIYYSAPKKRPALNSLDEVDPEIRVTFEKLGIPLEEQKLLGTKLGELTGKPASSKLHIHPITEESSELGDEISVISSERNSKYSDRADRSQLSA